MLTLPEVDTCYFCDIIGNRSGSWNVLVDNELTTCLLNGRQFERGQSMVVPNRHVPTLLDLESSEAAAVMLAAQRLAGIMMETFSPSGILLYQNNGVGSGQEVPHFHLHVVPRQDGSDWGLGPPHLRYLDAEGRSSRFDHTAATAEKAATVEILRQKIASNPEAAPFSPRDDA